MTTRDRAHGSLRRAAPRFASTTRAASETGVGESVTVETMRHSATLGAMIHATTTTRAATKVPTPTPTIDRRARARPSALPRASETTLAMTKISTPVIATVIATTLATTTGAALAIDMQIVDSQTRDYMKRRDEAAAFKCTGGMFDCDSDRREYARAQSERMAARLSTNAAGDEMAPACTVEDPCTTDVLRAALAGVQGLTTSDKLEAMGRDVDVVNSTSRYAIFD